MNLRRLCELQEYPIALLTTYNFDPLFFERVVRFDLQSGGAKRIIVLADMDQAFEAIERSQEQLLALGREYRLIPVSGGGAFHPKICIRLGPQGAIVACGSHNLSGSGWLGRTPKDGGRGNREVTVAWRVLPDSPAAGDLKTVLTGLSELVETPADRNAVLDLLDTSWLAGADSNNSKDWSWLLAGRQTLAATLEQRWAGRRFDRLRIVTGSTDDKGAMIRWAAKTFGIREAVVEVDADRCGFNPLLLKNLPIDLRLHLTDGGPRTHLKVVLFESSKQSAAVVGSANCSSAAWLLPDRLGGNIESVVVYDQCSPALVSRLFQAKHGEAQHWKEVPLSPPEHTPSTVSEKGPVRQLRRMQWSKTEERMSVRLSPDPDPERQVFAVFGGSRIQLHYSGPDQLWIGHTADMPEEIGTPFGWVEIGTERKATNSVWIDDLDRLNQAADWRMPLRAIRNLSQRAESSEYRRILGDLRLLSDSILRNTDDFPDMVASSPKKSNDKTEPPARPLEPGELIRSLSDLHDRPTRSLSTGDATVGYSLSGVMHLFFSEARDDDGVVGRYDPTVGESQKSQEEIEKQTEEQEEQAKRKEAAVTEDEPSEREKERLLQQLEEFVDHLATSEFAGECSARQLQQAVAYPLAVARFATEGPWGEDMEDSLSAVVVRTVEVLLRRNITIATKKGKAELKPLLSSVYDRYRAKGREADFQRVIGDGLLWLVLTGALGMVQRNKDNWMELCLLIADVAQTGALIATAVPERLVPLARRLGKAGSPLARMDKIRTIVDAVNTLEKHLEKVFNRYDKTKRVFDDKVGDWVWRTGVGFGKVMDIHENKKKGSLHIRKQADEVNTVYLDFYVNLRQLQTKDSVLTSLLSDLNAAAG